MAEERISYSLFEDAEMGLFPRVAVSSHNKDLNVEASTDDLWVSISYILIENPPCAYPLGEWYSFALFELCKNMFKQESDLTKMALFYTQARNKVRDVVIAGETNAIIDRLAAQNADRDLVVSYNLYQVKSLWKNGHFAQAVQV
jgi:hypothetical protein